MVTNDRKDLFHAPGNFDAGCHEHWNAHLGVRDALKYNDMKTFRHTLWYVDSVKNFLRPKIYTLNGYLFHFLWERGRRGDINLGSKLARFRKTLIRLYVVGWT